LRCYSSGGIAELVLTESHSSSGESFRLRSYFSGGRSNSFCCGASPSGEQFLRSNSCEAIPAEQGGIAVLVLTERKEQVLRRKEQFLLPPCGARETKSNKNKKSQGKRPAEAEQTLRAQTKEKKMIFLAF